MFAVILAGAGGAMGAWLVARPAIRTAMAPDALKAMPWVWRLCWPWVSAAALVCGPLLSWRLRAVLGRQIAQAGLPAVVTAAHAAALVACAVAAGAAFGGGLAWWLGLTQAWVLAAMAGALLAGGWPVAWARRRVGQRRRRIGRELPFVLDMMTLCVESGLGLHGALQQAEQHGPPGPLRQELNHALADMRAGMPRATALKALAERAGDPAVRSWIAALIQADGLGMSLGAVLRGHAAQCRTDRFQRAEKLAMEAPVKMLLPLIGCIFPCTFIVLAFPLAVQLWQATQ
ncbi:type II secretion system F family protein [Bordetella sp. BOR01]|uniref:type II secretion system F family protein n=1 Tax=Bordetella sp. BOR01 TaxID=2854779 RepID=UPI00210340D3|nr:type II secretion system F family protein [Bordetella sp. BOR01]